MDRLLLKGGVLALMRGACSGESVSTMHAEDEEFVGEGTLEGNLGSIVAREAGARVQGRCLHELPAEPVGSDEWRGVKELENPASWAGLARRRCQVSPRRILGPARSSGEGRATNDHFYLLKEETHPRFEAHVEGLASGLLGMVSCCSSFETVLPSCPGYFGFRQVHRTVTSRGVVVLAKN